MNKASRVFISTLLAVAVNNTVHASPHKDIAPLGQDVASQIVGQPHDQIDLLALVQSIKYELQNTEVLIAQLSKKAHENDSFFSRFFIKNDIESEITTQINTFNNYKNKLSKITLIAENKNKLIDTLDNLSQSLQQVVDADSDGKVAALIAASTVIKQVQQVDDSKKNFELPATPHTLKQQVITDNNVPAEGLEPYYVNPEGQPRIHSRRKRHLTQADTPINSDIPVRTNADTCYENGQINRQDLAETTDVQLTDEIKSLAKKLDYSPLNILNYVSNNIDYELYQGSVKGAAGALSSLGGNDTDQASLVVALLRASGYPARYVRGNIEFDPTRSEHLRWVRLKSMTYAANTLSNVGKKIALQETHEKNTTFNVDHVWVEACVPYANYRGNQQDQSGYQWLPLDASYKVHNLISGIKHSEKFDYTHFFQQRSGLLAHEFYEEQIEKVIRTVRPNATIQQVGDRWVRKKRQYTHIPETLPFKVANYSRWSEENEASSVAVLPDSHRKKLFIEINGSQKTTVDFLDTTQKRLTLSFEGVSANDQQRYRQWQQGKETLTCPTSLSLKPVIKLDGTVVSSQNPITVPLCQGNGFKKLNVKVGYKLGESETDTNVITFDGISPLNYHAIQSYGFQSSDQYLEKRTHRLLSAINSTANPWDNPDAIVGEYLDVVLLKFMRYITDGSRYIGELDSKSTFSGHHIGLTSTQAKVEYLFDMPLALNATNLLVDVPGAISIFTGQRQDDNLNDTFKLSGVLASQYESYIWQENAERDAVSTISGLQIAHQQKIPVKSFTSPNELKNWLISCKSGQKPPQCYPANAVANLAEQLKKGGELTIPQHPINYDGWTGLTAMHTSKKFAGFSIGRYNGGYALNTRINNLEHKIDSAGYLNNFTFGLEREIEQIRTYRPIEANQLWTKLTFAKMERESKKRRQQELERLRNLSLHAKWQKELYERQQAKVKPAPVTPIVVTPTRPAITTPSQPITPTRPTTPSVTSIVTTPSIAPHSINSLKTKGISPGQNDGGDPVNLITGNMYHIETDFSYPARGLPLIFTRTYNSLGINDGPLGHGWTHSFNHLLKFKDGDIVDNKTSEVVWVDGTGAERIIRLFSDHITEDGVGTLVEKNIMTPPGLYFKFKQVDSGYEIIEKNGLVYSFNSVSGKVGDIAQLTSVRDTLGNTLILSYENGKLTSVKDPDQRQITFTYNEAGYLNQVKDWVNNTYRYEYDDQQNLVSAWTPDNKTHAASAYTYYQTSDGPTLNHRMKTFRYANGYQMTFEYYPNGKVFRHYNAKNETMVFKYNTFRRETQTINERGHTERFFFDKKGSLIKKIDLNGGKHIHEFGNALDPFLRTAYTNPLGHTVRYEYDAFGNVIKQTMPSGDTVEYIAHNNYGRPRVIKNAEGDFVVHLYNEQGLLQEKVSFKHGKTLEFDPYTATAETIAAQANDIIAWTRYHYNALGNQVKKQSVKDFANPQSGPYVEYDYQDKQNKVNGIYPTRISYFGDVDGDGIMAVNEGYGPYTLEYDALGNEVKGHDVAKYPVENQYASSGRLLASVDNQGIKTSYQYDPSGLVVGKNQSSFTNGKYTSFSSTTYRYDQANRLVTSADQAGAITRYQHDALGNITQTTNPDGYHTQSEYDRANQLTSIKGADDRVTYYQYDLLGRKVAVTYPGGHVQLYLYHGVDHNGRLHKAVSQNTPGNAPRVVTYEYNKNGLVTKLTDQLNRSKVTEYDSLGRAIRVISPVYEDKVLNKIRPVTRYIYNSLGFLTQVEAGYTNEAGERSADQVSVQATYAYDDFGRKRTETNALNHTWTFSYDEHDQLTETTSPEGQVTRYSYDEYGQLISRRTEQTNQAVQFKTYQYNHFGQVTQVANNATRYDYTYDRAHRVASIKDHRANKTLYYRYSKGGLLNKVADSDGRAVYYHYDPVGRLTGIQAGAEQFNFAYDPAGRLMYKRLPNKTLTQYNYYNEGSVKSIEVLNTRNAKAIERHVYQYNGAGLVSLHSHLQGEQQQLRRYHYDPLNRLTKVLDQDNRIHEQIHYDPFGNWRERVKASKIPGAADANTYQEKTQFFTYNTLHQLTAIQAANEAGEPGETVSEYQYDKNGRLISRKNEQGLLTLTYNALGQLVQAQNPQAKVYPATYNQANGSPQPAPEVGLVETYLYGPEGNRLQKTTNGHAVNYWYNGDSIWAEYTNNFRTFGGFYLHGSGTDQPLVRIARRGKHYYHADQLGSVTTVTDHRGNASGQKRYTAWGEEDATTPKNDIPTYGYTGREPDASGLIYYRSRYYDPSIGRFTQQDPLGFVDGVNRYAYVMNNPVAYVDPWGLMSTEPSYTQQVTAAAWFYSFAAEEMLYQRVIKPMGENFPGGLFGALHRAREDRKMTQEEYMQSIMAAGMPSGGVGVLGKIKALPKITPTYGSTVLRAVTPEQVKTIRAGQGILKPTPAHKTTPTQHVGGTKHSRNPWTSTTRSSESANFFATHGGTRPANPIVEIDLSQINPSNIIDVSTAAKAAEHLTTPFTRNAAAAHQEVLIKGDIPASAIRFVE